MSETFYGFESWEQRVAPNNRMPLKRTLTITVFAGRVGEATETG